MSARHLFRSFVVTTACALSAVLGLRAQVPSQPTAADKYKNIQVLKIRADQLPITMEYFAASLGVRCNFCHVITPEGAQYDKDDRNAKKTARKMIDMVTKFNADQKDIVLTCATCHHGRQTPERTPPLALEMTPAEAGLLLGVGAHNVRDLVRRKRLRARKVGGRVRVGRHDVDELVRARRRCA